MTDIRIDPSKVTSIYMGRDNVCRCGCNGEYLHPGQPKFDKRVKRFCQMLEGYVPKDHDVVEGVYVNVSYGKDRALTVYFDDRV